MKKRLLLLSLSLLILLGLLTLPAFGKVNKPTVDGKGYRSEGEVKIEDYEKETLYSGRNAINVETGSEKVDEAAEEEAGESEEKPAWKITGWQLLFGLIAGAFYILALKLLPVLIEDKRTEGEGL